MFCSKCGNKSPMGARFCHKCGTKIVADVNPVQHLEYPTQSTPGYPMPGSQHPDTGMQYMNNPPPYPQHYNPYQYPQMPQGGTGASSDYPAPQQPPQIQEPQKEPELHQSMDYTFFPDQPSENEIEVENEIIIENTNFIDYPIDISKPKPVKEELSPPNYSDLINYSATPPISGEMQPQSFPNYENYQQIPHSQVPYNQTPPIQIPPYQLPQNPMPQYQMPTELPPQSFTNYPPPSMPLESGTQFMDRPSQIDFQPLPTEREPVPSFNEFADYQPPPAPVAPPKAQPHKYIDSGVPFLDDEESVPFRTNASIVDKPEIVEPDLFFTDREENHSRFKDHVDFQPAERQEYPSEDYDDYYGHSTMVTHVPNSKGKLLLVGIASVVLIAVVVIVIMFVRRGVSPDQLVGTWTPPGPQMGVWVLRMEFNDDGTGRQYNFDEQHLSTSNEVPFTWSIEGRNTLISSLWPDEATVQVSTRSGERILRYQFEGTEAWHEYRQVRMEE